MSICKIGRFNPETVREELKPFIGLHFHLMPYGEKDTWMYIQPIYKEELDKYWKLCFDNGMKDTFTDDYKEFLEMMLSGEECFISKVTTNELMEIRDATQEDAKNYEEAIDSLIEKYGLDRERIENA